MSGRPLHRITIAVSVLAVIGRCFAQEGQSQKPPAPAGPAKAAPSSPTVARPQQNGLKNLESDLFKPFKGLSTDSSLDSVLTAPAQPPQARPLDERRIRDKRQRNKDWEFLTPDDSKETQSLEEMLNLPTKDKNSKNQKNLSPVEQYYRRVLGFDSADQDNFFSGGDRKKPGKKNIFDSPSAGTAGDSDDGDDSSLLPGLRATKRSLKALNDDQPDKKENNSALNGKGFFTDIFGLGQSLPTPAEIEAKRVQRQNMNDFRKILGVPVVAPSPMDSLDPLAGLRPTASSSAPPISIPSVSTAIKPSVPNVQLGTIGGLGAAFTAPQNNSSLASPFAAPTAPVIDQPRRVLPKSPDFSPPQRHF
jgi:hypothetical protein